MKSALPIILFLFFSLITSGQSLENPEVIHISQVSYIPAWKDCESKGLPCTMKSIQKELLRNFDSRVIGSGKKERSVLINLKFIIDTTGKVIWATAVGPTPEIREEGIRVVKEFPGFSPGRHEGKEVNVLVDFPVRLSFGKPFKSELSETREITEIDLPPHFDKCREEEDLISCSSREIADYVNTHLNTHGLDKGFHETTVRFIIDRKGRVQDVFAGGLNEKFNKRAVKVVQRLPRFNPGKQEGETISTFYLLPITIDIFK